MLRNLLKLACAAGLLLTLSACDFLLFDPKGPIAAEQMELIILSFAVMLIVVIPVFVMTFVFAIKYRAGNDKADYRPLWEHSNLVEIVVWSVPLVIIVVLGIITYRTSFSLDPRQPIASEQQTMRIQVVALDWKWLFIYPEQEIATVNELALPVDTPVEFLITSDTVMNSFFVPQLGSMIYAMAGMENQLNLIADETGVYRGLSANYSGFGFSGMKFKAHVKTEAEFKQWIAEVKRAANPLSEQAYQLLSVKSKDHPVEYYSSVNPLMFNRIIEKYTGEQNGE
ncbi:ubiquinol oxidase subunit 2 [Arenicella chitinivorans]|uniref:Ubiquinol oxidase subunit 2 n=1 Tax=Arenicella chitinivorans TaxID=1329800 RepID=A0A918VLL7_9GAMM|nr:ubiquinol oxidase subunit II [Arenicella chitinivorans]GHA11255.1 ubiquinol oxidase subunit 2 [Arenicella chitinivorans]